MASNRVVARAEIRRRGDTAAWDLILDGEVFPFALRRQELEVEPLVDGDNPLLSLHLEVFVESVVGREAFNEFLAEEADASRVRSADYRDGLYEVGIFRYGTGQGVPESDFERLWNMR